MTIRAPLSTRIERRSFLQAIESQCYQNHLARTNSGIKPFALLDQPNPERGKPPSIALKTWTDGPRLNLIGRDQFFAAPGQPLSYDWQNPRGKAHAVSLRTEAYSPLLTTLQVVFAVPYNQYDWPVPKGKQSIVPLRSSADGPALNLIGKDQFYGAAGEPVSYHWPNPSGKQGAARLLYSTETVGLPTLLASPFFGFTFENPRKSPPNQSHLDSVKLNLLGQDLLFGAPGQTQTYDWQNPRISRSSSALKSEYFQPLTLSVTVAIPYNQYDWKPPAGKAYPVSLRTFTDPLKLLLLNKDVLYGAPGQTKTFDWPVPRGKQPSQSLRTFAQSTALTYAPVIIDTSNYVLVPYLIGDTESSARARIASIYCTVSVVGSTGTVTTQDPAHMSLVARGTLITITLGGTANNPRRGNGGWPNYGSSVN